MSSRNFKTSAREQIQINLLTPVDSKITEQEQEQNCIIIKTSQETNDTKWHECKINGQNLSPRSNCTMVIVDEFLYMFGGYSYTFGIMKDFYKINLKQQLFIWEKISEDDIPGPHCQHSMCYYNNRIYLFGGQIGDTISTNDLYSYIVNEKKWTKLIKNNTYPPAIDNCVGVCIDNEWILFGGFFGGKLCQHSNSLFSYSFQNNQWKQLQNKSNMSPAPRDGSSLACIQKQLYIFGGKNGNLRYNDLWKYDLNNNYWSHIPINSVIPKSRSGHSLISYNNQLILFGGIHDITWELDDLYIFNPLQQEWKQIDCDTSRRNELDSPSPQKKQTTEQKKKSRKAQFPYLRPLSLKKSPRILSPEKLEIRSQTRNSTYDRQQGNHFTFNTQINERAISVQTAPSNILIERKKQEFRRKKCAMLKLFEIQDKDKWNFQEDCVITEKLRTSIIVLGNPKQDFKVKEGKLTEFGKPLISKFLQPLNGTNTIMGKKPCARDGHATALYQNYMLIFGGDRHTMSFNDLYQLNLDQL